MTTSGETEYIKEQQAEYFFSLFLEIPSSELNYRELSRNANVTWKIVQKYPTFPWDYHYLSENPNITWNIVRESLQLPWDFQKISQIPSVTWDIIQRFPELPWSYYGFSINPNLTWDIVENHPDLSWDFHLLSFSSAVTWDIIKNNPQFPWNLNSFISHNPNASWDVIRPDIQRYLNDASVSQDSFWDTFHVSSLLDLKDMTWEIIKSSSIPIQGCYYSTSSLITWEIVKDHPDIRWSYFLLLINPKITWDALDRSGDQWLSYISQFLQIPGPSINDFYRYLSSNPSITWDIVKNNPNKPWDYSALSNNATVTCDIINDNLHRPWSFKIFSSNPNVTWEFIRSHRNREWNYSLLANNTTPYQNRLIEIECRRRWNAAQVIQRNFLKAYWSIEHPLGKERLRRSYIKV